MPLDPPQRRQLRARAHALKPVVQVGDAGLSEPLLAEAARALDDHGLIKVRLPALERVARAEMAAALCAALGAEEVQAIGRVRVLWRAPPRKRRARGRRAGGGSHS